MRRLAVLALFNRENGRVASCNNSRRGQGRETTTILVYSGLPYPKEPVCHLFSRSVSMLQFYLVCYRQDDYTQGPLLRRRSNISTVILPWVVRTARNIYRIPSPYHGQCFSDASRPHHLITAAEFQTALSSAPPVVVIVLNTHSRCLFAHL